MELIVVPLLIAVCIMAATSRDKKPNTFEKEKRNRAPEVGSEDWISVQERENLTQTQEKSIEDRSRLVDTHDENLDHSANDRDVVGTEAYKERLRQQLHDLRKKREQEEQEYREVQAKRAQIEIEINLAKLTRSLPFFLSDNNKPGQGGMADEKRWSDVLATMKTKDRSPTTLYLVEILNLLEDKTYTKIGVTSGAVEDRFSRSTQVELKTILASASLPRFQALFCEYHFIREFQITEDISQNSDMSSPKLKFSGHTEVVRPNSTSKIIGFMEQLEPLTLD